jgi:glycine/D-amino acid oxidase-like deaminating enzyme
MMDPVAITADATSSWWLQHLPPDLAPPASTALPTTADVLIVGAGITGCATAYWLQKLYGRSSIVLDARCLCGGATGRNGGHLWANPSSEFECHIGQNIGHRAARRSELFLTCAERRSLYAEACAQVGGVGVQRFSSRRFQNFCRTHD